MLTVTQLAQTCDVSRTTVLYYERAGLLKPASRSANGYRWYGAAEVERLKNILSYRSYGVPVSSIGALLEDHDNPTQEQVLRDHFNALEKEIQNLRQQQKAIVMLLEQGERPVSQAMTKERWTDIMAAAGFSEADMLGWHRQFEQMEPEGHQAFLESLAIDEDEVERIRLLSGRKALV